ncbi:MAG: choice-of-anchor Q domain-containing protein [Lysobacterales bacterium]
MQSTLSGNTIEATEPEQNANGGGVAANPVFTIAGSTFSSNSADGVGGGAIGSLSSYHLPVPTAPSDASGISNSTFTWNSAELAGAFADANALPVANSTVAFNTSRYGGAVAILDSGTAQNDYTLYLDSTIIARNSIDGPGGHAADLATSPQLTLTVIGSNNLVGSADPNVTLPPDTLNSDPMLLPLADNGGPTWTMALATGSPAINTGSNPWNFDTDQRGAGFPRVYGSAADIGAYEVQSFPDEVFASGFDP